MQRLIDFLRRFSFLFTFIILEGICIAVIVNNNPLPSAWYFSATSRFQGVNKNFFTDLSNYFHLNKINHELTAQNAQLLSESQFAYIPMDTSTFAQVDFTKILGEKKFNFIPAKVIGNTVYQSNNIILLNKGREDNIRKDMGVISPAGIVGMIVEVSDNYAAVLSLISRSTLISAKIIPDNHIGTISWDGKDKRVAIMRDIPTHISLNKGDTVVTSGFSMMYPENIMIGTIDDYELDHDKSYYRIKINLSTDFTSLQWVYIVDNLFAEEQTNLMNQVKTDLTVQ